MKKITTFLVFATIISFSACKKKDDAESKKADLEKYKKEVLELNAKIKDLEKDLAASGNTDTTSSKNAKQVVVQNLNTSSFNHYLEIQGKVDSDKNITVSPVMAGSITSINVERGQKVKRGQVLGRLDSDAITKGIDELKSSLAFATTMYEKQKRLWDQQIGTEVQYLTAKNQKESLERKLSTVNEQYENSIVKSPIDGEIDEIFIRVGELISPGMPAFRVVNTTGYKIKAEIPESYISKIQPGDEVKVFLPDLNDTIVAKLQTVSNVINPTNRTFTVEIPLKGIQKNLKANMIAYLNILDYTKPNAISIPLNVIQHTEEGDYVFVEENGKAKKKYVKTGTSYKTTTEITEGLQAGDKLIVVGFQELVDGQPVKI